jgi:hypothetical protein
LSLTSILENREKREGLLFYSQVSSFPEINSGEPQRKHLSSQFGFDCACEVCTLPEEQVRLSDARLVALADLERQVTLWSTWEMDGPAAIELLKKMWELSDQEGYWYGRGEIAEDATAIAVAHSE